MVESKEIRVQKIKVESKKLGQKIQGKQRAIENKKKKDHGHEERNPNC